MIHLLGVIRVNLFLRVAELLSDTYGLLFFVFMLVFSWYSDSFGSRGSLSDKVVLWDESVFGSATELVGLQVVRSCSLEVQLSFCLLFSLGCFLCL